ncbi:isopenicillin N synthase family dioxygenase [Aeromicrobium stalagmiti]|uniref:isopenicillin N synthase family dioxygenase n=1 Tax=Aeromicrobium stalagmiti TaxID=2738988 RepID=UPI00156A6E04|nr:isopenicillin N synthase family oxygenase [Aeromicrobium stalagmiti]NRQ50458.1 isopenicillin N synthase family oxygenase [Aeromicrobium stalagmiti]
MTFSVPTVDISAYVQGGSPRDRGEVAAQVDRACREVGFIQVVGHGVPDEVVAGLGEAMDGFFGCTMDEKTSYVRPPGENRGYSAPKSESLSLSLGVESAGRMADFFEAFNVGRTIHDHPGVTMPEHYADNTWPELTGFESRVETYLDEAERVAETMVGIFADALGLPAGYFDAFTDHSINVLRMNNYALPAGTDVTLDGELTGMGEHTDFGIVTILWADQVRGLQVLGDDGGWHDVSPAEGALLVNIGDLMARWTNEQWMSTLHRVKPPIVDGTIQRRRSAAFFHDGNADAVITTLPSCVDAEHPDLYAPVTVAEHVAAKLAGSRAGRINTDAVREAERVLQSQR